MSRLRIIRLSTFETSSGSKVSQLKHYLTLPIILFPHLCIRTVVLMDKAIHEAVKVEEVVIATRILAFLFPLQECPLVVDHEVVDGFDGCQVRVGFTLPPPKTGFPVVYDYALEAWQKLKTR